MGLAMRPIRRRTAGGTSMATAATFDQARNEFEAAWATYLPDCTEADFQTYRTQRRLGSSHTTAATGTVPREELVVARPVGGNLRVENNKVLHRSNSNNTRRDVALRH